MESRPTLLSACAAATTAGEARFRIDGPAPKPRAARVVALDPGADEMVGPFLDQPWRGAQFLSCRVGQDSADPLNDLALTSSAGEPLLLGEVLADADFMMMVATSGAGAASASAIGMACTLRGIMTAGLILGEDGAADAAVRALRPHARVLLVSRDAADVAELLDAVGA